MGRVTLKGNPVETVGDLPAVGSEAPDFRLVNADMAEMSLSDFEGKKKILSIVPSLDTGVCATMARTFNEKAAARDDVAVLVVSADLPFAQKRFCATEGIDGVTTLSMIRTRKFAKDYGVLMTSGPLEGLAARAVVVLDEQNRVVHSQLVGEIAEEPDYDAALAHV